MKDPRRFPSFEKGRLLNERNTLASRRFERMSADIATPGAPYRSSTNMVGTLRNPHTGRIFCGTVIVAKLSLENTRVV